MTPLSKLTDGYRSSLQEQSLRKRTSTTTSFLRGILDDAQIAEDADAFLDQIKSGEILVRVAYKVTGQDISKYQMTGSFWKHLIEFKECCIDMGIPPSKCFGPTELQNRDLAPILECLSEVQKIWEAKTGSQPKELFAAASNNSSGANVATHNVISSAEAVNENSSTRPPHTPQHDGVQNSDGVREALQQLWSGSRSGLRLSIAADNSMCLKSHAAENARKLSFSNDTTTLVKGEIVEDNDQENASSDNNELDNPRVSLLREIAAAHEEEKAQLEAAHKSALQMAEEHQNQVKSLTEKLENVCKTHVAEMQQLQMQHQEALAAEKRAIESANAAGAAQQTQELQEALDKATAATEHAEQRRINMIHATKSHQEIVHTLRGELLQLKEVMSSCTKFAEIEVCDYHSYLRSITSTTMKAAKPTLY